MSPHLLLSMALALTGPALDQLRDAAGSSGYGPIPVSDPVCVENCQQQPANQQSNETAGQRAARAAAEAEAQRRAEEAARVSRAESDEAERALRSLDLDGARLRETAERFQREERREIERETRAGALRPQMAPVPAVVPAPAATPRPSLTDYVRKLNEEERARQRGLRVVAPPPLPPPPPPVPASPIAPTAVAAFETPPRVGPESVKPLLAEVARLRAAVKEDVENRARKKLWSYAENAVPGLKSMRSIVAEYRKTSRALEEMIQRNVGDTFSQAGQVAWSLGSGATRPSVTDGDNTALLQRWEGDVNDTTGTLMRDKVTGGASGTFVKWAPGWLGGSTSADSKKGGGQ